MTAPVPASDNPMSDVEAGRKAQPMPGVTANGGPADGVPLVVVQTREAGSRAHQQQQDGRSSAVRMASPRQEPGASTPASLQKVGATGATRDTAKAAEQEGQGDSEEDGPGDFDLLWAVTQAAPPWLASFIVHMLGLILIALLTIPTTTMSPVKLVAVLSEEVHQDLGRQLDDPTVTASLDQRPDETPAVEDPSPLMVEPELASPLLDLVPDSIFSTYGLSNLSLQAALTGRATGLKEKLLAAYGGNERTEAAVKRALEWLKRQQRRDGSWSLTGPYKDGADSDTDNPLAATAMAMLAFQGAGNTHQRGDYKEELAKANRWLQREQGEDGNFWRGDSMRDHLYSHAQATIAICELYGMSQDADLRRPAQRAIDYAVDAQAEEGGWRYYPGRDSDTSVTGWFVMAFQSAMMAGLEVPSPTLDRVTRYLDGAATDDGARYAYQPGHGSTPAMTAEALLCRQYLGWRRDDPRLVEGVEYLRQHPIDWHDQNVYHWYYATQVMHHMGGAAWEGWNSVMRDRVPAHQVPNGPEFGSWSPREDRWGIHGGRLFTTCLYVYMLEVYYRHLPIYSHRATE